MSNSNLNNKFGKCCGCPPIMTRGRLFRNFVSSHIFEDSNRKRLNMPDSHAYRKELQTNAISHIQEPINNLEKNHKCKSDSNNKFYIDSSKFNFSTPLENNYQGPQMPNNYVKKSTVANF